MNSKRMIATGIVIFIGFLTLVFIGKQAANWADNIAEQTDARNAEIVNILQQ